MSAMNFGESPEYIGQAGAGSTWGTHRFKAVVAFICKHGVLYYPLISRNARPPA